MPKIKTSQLRDGPLDYAVALTEGAEGIEMRTFCLVEYPSIRWSEGYRTELAEYQPSKDWRLAGTFIDSEGISIECLSHDEWKGTVFTEHLGYSCHGDSALEAAMRALVLSKLGEEVEIPSELL